jgi:hypothetical protein
LTITGFRKPALFSIARGVATACSISSQVQARPILAAEKVGRIGFGTLPINWRGVATTDPELAVEAVRGGAGRTTSTGLTGI